MRIFARYTIPFKEGRKVENPGIVPGICQLIGQQPTRGNYTITDGASSQPTASMTSAL
jgi:hypothetical protein